MPSKRWNLVCQPTTRDSTSLASAGGWPERDQFMLNCHVDGFPNDLKGSGRLYVRPREAYSGAASGSGTTVGTAVKLWTGKGADAYAVGFGSTIYVNGSSVGSITGTPIFFSETKNSGTATLVIVSSSNRAYYYPDGGAITEITNTDFPPKQTSPLTLTGNFAHMNDFAFIMATNGQIWNSDYRNITSWNSQSYIECDFRPDNGVAVVRNGDMIIGFGVSSSDVFKNAQNPVGSPLARVASFNIGLMNQYCAVQFMDTVAFIGAYGGYGVYMMNGVQPKKVSSPAIDALIQSSSNLARLNVLSSFGRPMLALSFDVALPGIAVYDPVYNIWSYWDLGTSHLTQSDVGNVQGTSVINSCIYVGDNSSNYFKNADSGSVSAYVQTEPIDFGTSNRKILNSIRVIGESEVSSTVTIGLYSDDYSSFVKTSSANIGTRDYPEIARWGNKRRFAFRVEFASDTGRAARLQALDFDYTVGST